MMIRLPFLRRGMGDCDELRISRAIYIILILAVSFFGVENEFLRSMAYVMYSWFLLSDE